MNMYEKFMKIAIKEAEKAKNKNEVPVGVVIVKDNKIISKAHNLKEKYNDSTQHAEILAIKKACKKFKNWRLNDCLLFATMEPCIMCIGAIVESRIKTVICGVKNDKYHNDIIEICKRHDINIEYELLNDQSSKLLKTFFENERKK